MSDLISRRALLKKLESMTNDNSEYIRNNSHQFTYKELAYIICNQPTAYDIEKVVAELEERTAFLKNCTKYGNENTEQQEKSYSTMMMYEIADLVDDLIDIVRKGGAE